MEDFTGRALAGEPLAYILEEWDFYGMTLYVNRDVLIPRDDTCAVTELALKKALFLEQDPRILDLCTGSGCIGPGHCQEGEGCQGHPADVSREALVVAKKNAAAMKLTGRVSCIQADARQDPSAFLGTFDLIGVQPTLCPFRGPGGLAAQCPGF